MKYGHWLSLLCCVVSTHHGAATHHPPVRHGVPVGHRWAATEKEVNRTGSLLINTRNTGYSSIPIKTTTAILTADSMRSLLLL